MHFWSRLSSSFRLRGWFGKKANIMLYSIFLFIQGTIVLLEQNENVLWFRHTLNILANTHRHPTGSAKAKRAKWAPSEFFFFIFPLKINQKFFEALIFLAKANIEYQISKSQEYTNTIFCQKVCLCTIIVTLFCRGIICSRYVTTYLCNKTTWQKCHF